MTAYPPPLYSFNGLDFNPTIFETTSSSGLTESQANNLYLQKKVADTATAQESFSGGILVSTVDGIGNLSLGQLTSGDVYIGNSLFSTYFGSGTIYAGDIEVTYLGTNQIESLANDITIGSNLGAFSSIEVGASNTMFNNYGHLTCYGLMDATVGITMPTQISTDDSTYGATTAFVQTAISALSSIYQTASQVTTSINSALSTFLTTTHTWTASQTMSSVVTPILNYAGLLTIGSNSTGINIGTGTTTTLNITGTTIALAGQARATTLVLTSATVPSIDTSIGTTLLIGTSTASGINLGKASSTVAIQGNITMPTKIASDNSTFGATTAYVTTAISALSSIYQTAAQVTTAITSYGYQTATDITTAITNLKSANNTWSGTNNFTNFLSVNSNSVMSVRNATTTQTVIFGIATSGTAGPIVSFGYTFNTAPYVFLTNINLISQGVSANTITTTNFKLYSSAGSPNVQWMAIGN